MTQNKQVAHEVKILAHLIKRNIDHGLEFQPTKATAVHGHIIRFLYDRQDQDIFQRDIEQECGIRRSTATGILQCMEKNGAIRRESVKQDARLKKIILTDKAKAMHESIAKTIEDTEAKLTRNISPEEIECFFRVLDKMKHNLK